MSVVDRAKLRDARAAKGWSREELSFQIRFRGGRVSARTIARLEDSEGETPGVDILGWLADTLGVGIETLLKRTAPEPALAATGTSRR